MFVQMTNTLHRTAGRKKIFKNISVRNVPFKMCLVSLFYKRYSRSWPDLRTVLMDGKFKYLPTGRNIHLCMSWALDN